MHYKTIVLELLEQQTELYEQLRKTRQLLPTLEALATELRDRHIAMTEWLTQASPDSDPSQIPSQALELALKDLEDCLPSESPQDDREPLSLEQAMVFIRSHTPNK
jgi:hypothetical protein